MYTACSRRIPRVTNNIRERGKEKEIMIRGIRRMIIMLTRVKMKRRR
jgi:hypothetical protein